MWSLTKKYLSKYRKGEKKILNSPITNLLNSVYFDHTKYVELLQSSNHAEKINIFVMFYRIISKTTKII